MLDHSARESNAKLTHRNQLLERLTSETSRLKCRFEEKLTELGRVHETLARLQQSFADANTLAEQTRLKHSLEVSLLSAYRPRFLTARKWTHFCHGGNWPNWGHGGNWPNLDQRGSFPLLSRGFHLRYSSALTLTILLQCL